MSDFFLMLQNSLTFVMDLTYIEIFGVSVFQVALINFLAFTFFRFIVSPLISTGGGSWGLGKDISDTVQISKANQQKKTISNRIGFR